jgi:hypothetical protein
LWKSFISSFFPETLSNGEFGSLASEYQRETVQNFCPLPWKGWCMWINHMLHEETKSPVASELVFSSLYKEKLDKNEQYQQQLRKMPEVPKYKLPTANSIFNNLHLLSTGTANTWAVDSYDTTTYTDS